MSPENASVIIVEDDPDFVEILQEVLEMSGHTVVDHADSINSGEDLISQTPPESIDVVLLDGNLSKGDASGRDGAALSKLVREMMPGKPVISISLEEQSWSDSKVTKRSGIFAIADAVSKA